MLHSGSIPRFWTTVPVARVYYWQGHGQVQRQVCVSPGGLKPSLGKMFVSRKKHYSKHFPVEPEAVCIMEVVYLCFVSRVKGAHGESQALFHLDRIHPGHGWRAPFSAHLLVRVRHCGRMGGAALAFLAGVSSLHCHKRMGLLAGFSQEIRATNPISGSCGLLHRDDRRQ